MERLTFYSMKGSENDGYYLKAKATKRDLIDRLGSYESTGMTPKQVSELQAENEKLKSEIEFLSRRNASCGQCENFKDQDDWGMGVCAVNSMRVGRRDYRVYCTYWKRRKDDTHD